MMKKSLFLLIIIGLLFVSMPIFANDIEDASYQISQSEDEYANNFKREVVEEVKEVVKAELENTWDWKEIAGLILGVIIFIAQALGIKIITNIKKQRE